MMKKNHQIIKSQARLFLIFAILAVGLTFSLTTVLAKTMYENQRDHVNLRFGMFIHFNMGTFHDAEWVNPGQDPLSFNPVNLDCNQWATAAKSAGMTYAVLTTKHHDGFCLWPSQYTTYDVMSSSYKQDIVRKYVDAFRAQGLLPCFYFSIWDRNQGVESGSVTRADIDFVKGQLTELLTNYGDIPLLIIDGWAWQMGHQQVPYGEIREHIKSLQPDCLIVDLNGITEPWGTDVIFFEEPKGIWAPAGNTYASCQGHNIVSTGWFWHPSTPNATPISVNDIVNTHLKTLESRYCNFILNCPPNNKGLLDTNIVNRLNEVGAVWAPDTSRAALPAQPDLLLHAVTPVSVSATSGTASNAVDGKNDCGYQTLWESGGSLPQSVTLDLGNTYHNIDMLTYLPRQDNNTTGNITSFRVYVSSNGSSYTQVASGTWANDKVLKRIQFTAQTARYVRLEAVAATGGTAVASEIDIGGFANIPSVVGSVTPTPTSRRSSTPTPSPTVTPTRRVTPTPTRRVTPTPTGAVTPVPGSNLALGKTASADSQESSNPAPGGNDGSTSTRWCANDGNTGHWWKVDLGQSYNLTGSEVIWEFGGRVYQYKVEVSIDNENWTLAADKSSNTSTAQNQSDSFTAAARYVRITVTGLPTSPVTWASFFEFRAFGSSDSVTPTPTRAVTPTPTPTPTRRVTPTPTSRRSPTPTPTRRVTPTPTSRPGTPTPTPVSGGYVVIYDISSDWGSGGTINVTIQNNTTSGVNGWTLAWTFPGNQTITNLWGGAYTQNGVSVSVEDAGYNAYIEANGGAVSFGFNINYSGANDEPGSFTLNGTACQVQ